MLPVAVLALGNQLSARLTNQPTPTNPQAYYYDITTPPFAFIWSVDMEVCSVYMFVCMP